MAEERIRKQIKGTILSIEDAVLGSGRKEPGEERSLMRMVEGSLIALRHESGRLSKECFPHRFSPEEKARYAGLSCTYEHYLGEKDAYALHIDDGTREGKRYAFDDQERLRAT